MKLKNLSLASAFVVAIVCAFAFKSRPTLDSSYASFSENSICTNATGTVACDGGNADCVIGTKTYFSDQNCGTVLKKN